MKMGVQPSDGHQLLVVPLLDYATVIEYDDPVGFADGGEPVRDDQAPASFEQYLHGLLDLVLGLGVKG